MTTARVLSGDLRWHVEQGDCLAWLRTLPDNSVDSVATDPPYELAFMGKRWDGSGIAFNVELWREVLRRKLVAAGKPRGTRDAKPHVRVTEDDVRRVLAIPIPKKAEAA